MRHLRQQAATTEYMRLAASNPLLAAVSAGSGFAISWDSMNRTICIPVAEILSGGTKAEFYASLRKTLDLSRRMRNHVHKMSAQVVAYALRRRVECVCVDMTVKSYIPSYPWHALTTAIKYKCEDVGLHCIVATQVVAEPDVENPHVYFKLAPITGRVKIGKTGREDGGRHGRETDSSEELVILAVDNQQKTKLTAKEKHYHAMFAVHRLASNREWFAGEPVIEWLRAVGWLGNAGNLSQISQYLDVSREASSAGHLRPDGEQSLEACLQDGSQNAAQVATISDVLSAAVAMEDEIRIH